MFKKITETVNALKSHDIRSELLPSNFVALKSLILHEILMWQKAGYTITPISIPDVLAHRIAHALQQAGVTWNRREKEEK